uniref:Uncharacterized protein n=1 Tax=Sphaerodactylus townsendi TaxID=933632 RepID=A0ACB8EHE8_9SAUR
MVLLDGASHQSGDSQAFSGVISLAQRDGATAHLETGGFIRSRAGVPHPDIQFHFLPSQVIDHGRTASQLEAYQVHIGPMRSTSVGWLKLKSSDPRDHPILEANYLSTETDIFEFRQCVKLAREIFAQKPFEQYRGPEIQPGSHVQSDEEIDAFIRQKADSAYHPSCTCKMGQSSDSTAVVDPQTKVIGTENLRVVDASIMPSIVSGNLNAPTIMVAEKAADIIKGLPSLQEKNVPVYKPKTVETQRLTYHSVIMSPGSSGSLRHCGDRGLELGELYQLWVVEVGSWAVFATSRTLWKP